MFLKILCSAGIVFSINAFAASDKDVDVEGKVKNSEPVKATLPVKKNSDTKAVDVKSAILAPAKAAACVACHSADGNSPSPGFPKISALDKKYFLKQLKEFKKGAEGQRNNSLMQGMISQLSDDEMNELAIYYSSQVRTIETASSADFELGQRIYRAGNIKTGLVACSACHSPDGTGQPLAGFPNISGQYAEYITVQLNAFKTGDRKNDLNGIMHTVASKMSDKEIQAVSNYVSSLH